MLIEDDHLKAQFIESIKRLRKTLVKKIEDFFKESAQVGTFDSFLMKVEFDNMESALKQSISQNRLIDKLHQERRYRDELEEENDSQTETEQEDNVVEQPSEDELSDLIRDMLISSPKSEERKQDESKSSQQYA